MADEIGKIHDRGGREQNKDLFQRKREFKDIEPEKKKSSLGKIQDVYIPKEQNSSPEYSRDPKIRKLLMKQIKNQGKKP